jgi:hypothetical protein
MIDLHIHSTYKEWDKNISLKALCAKKRNINMQKFQWNTKYLKLALTQAERGQFTRWFVRRTGRPSKKYFRYTYNRVYIAPKIYLETDKKFWQLGSHFILTTDTDINVLKNKIILRSRLRLMDKIYNIQNGDTLCIF